MFATMLRRLTFCSVLLASLCFASTAGAEEESSDSREVVRFDAGPQLVFELRALTYSVPDSSFDALSNENAYSGGQLGVGYRLDALYPGLRGHVAYAGGGLSRSRFDDALDFSWRRDMFIAGAEWGPRFYGIFYPKARIGVGYSTQALDASTGGTTTSDRTHDPIGVASLGLDLFTTNTFGRLPVRLGVMSEFGYLAHPAADFEEMTFGDDWARQPTNFGQLHTGGLFWSIGLGVGLDL